jgi:phage shock protein PspC (stress-responsive transcriptional regulator)
MELTTSNMEAQSLLRRVPEGRLVAGVATGLAAHFDLDVAIVRIAFVVLSVVGGIGIPLYLAAWLLIPELGTDTTVAADLLDHLHLGGGAPGGSI